MRITRETTLKQQSQNKFRFVLVFYFTCASGVGILGLFSHLLHMTANINTVAYYSLLYAAS